MQPNNLTALDFEDIRSSIKSYLRTRTEFSDYDFDGSSLSYLIDTLAYNTYYTAFNANMALNESFLQSATVRDNIVNVAKLLNYVPKSQTSSRATVRIQIQTNQTNGSYPSSITLKKGPVASGGNYIWNTLEDITTEVDTSTGIADFGSVGVYEGAIINFSYIVNTFARQTYTIPSSNIDTATLSVRVKANESSTTSDIYNQVNNITTLTANTRAYFLSEGEDMRYEIRFGDDSVGRALRDGEVIVLEYLTTSGRDANEVGSFTFIGRLLDSLGIGYSASSVVLTTICKSRLGSSSESIESIKYNAPRYYSAQYRAVTAQDYEIIVKNIYPNADSVVAYGGDSLNPPIYGKVFVVIKTKTGTLLNDITKKQIVADLRKYAMASIDSVVTDPDNIYIYPKVFIQYDPSCSTNTSNIKTNVQNGITNWASQTQINNFSSTFKSQEFIKAITLSDSCVSDVSVQISILKYISVLTNETNTYCISTGSPLYNSSPSKDSDTGDSTDCKKEPVLLSGTFRTSDRPGVDQKFEDDGFGNLRTFYNTGTKKVYTNNNAGTVNYDTGEVCFGPISVIGTGTNVPSDTNLDITDVLGGTGSVIDTTLLPIDLEIPILLIPANTATIPATTPGTIINVVNPEITIASLGSTPPPTIPLNSLTPTVFNQTPTLVEVLPIDNSGSLNTSSCF